MAEYICMSIQFYLSIFAICRNQALFQIQGLSPVVWFPCSINLLIKIAERTKIKRSGIISDSCPANMRQHSAVSPGILHSLIINLQRQIAIPNRRRNIFLVLRIRLSYENFHQTFSHLFKKIRIKTFRFVPVEMNNFIIQSPISRTNINI